MASTKKIKELTKDDEVNFKMESKVYPTSGLSVPWTIEHNVEAYVTHVQHLVASMYRVHLEVEVEGAADFTTSFEAHGSDEVEVISGPDTTDR
jgi:hypothetical protein